MQGALQPTSELLSEVSKNNGMHVSNGKETLSEPGAGTLQAQTVLFYEPPHLATEQLHFFEIWIQ